MTFINVVVHTCEDLNYRVYMQHEFTLLGIDELLEKLEEAAQDFPALHKQIKAYQDNYFNVAALVSCWMQHAMDTIGTQLFVLCRDLFRGTLVLSSIHVHSQAGGCVL